jgi:hypothetical protein
MKNKLRTSLAFRVFWFFIFSLQSVVCGLWPAPQAQAIFEDKEKITHQACGFSAGKCRGRGLLIERAIPDKIGRRRDCSDARRRSGCVGFRGASQGASAEQQ